MMSDRLPQELPCCEVPEVHPERIARARQALPDEDALFALADLYKIFGDSTRLNILFAIDDGPLCVCDIAELLGMTKSAVSHQLRILRASDLIACRRVGKNVYYSPADDHVRAIIETALDHIRE